MNQYHQSVFVYAARYAHSRNTGAAQQIVSAITASWSELDRQAQEQLIREAGDATCNFEDWDKLKALAADQ